LLKAQRPISAISHYGFLSTDFRRSTQILNAFSAPSTDKGFYIENCWSDLQQFWVTAQAVIANTSTAKSRCSGIFAKLEEDDTGGPVVYAIIFLGGFDHLTSWLI